MEHGTALFGSATIVACVCLMSCRIADRVHQEESEADAIQRLRDIRSAQTTFRQRHSRFGTIVEVGAEGLLSAPPTGDGQVAFRFEFSVDPNVYAVVAIPATAAIDISMSVGRSFSTNQVSFVARLMARQTDTALPEGLTSPSRSSDTA